MNSKKARILLIAAAGLTGLLLVLFALGLLVVNSILLPSKIDSMITRVENRTEGRIKIDRSSYRPFRGLVLSGVSIHISLDEPSLAVDVWLDSVLLKIDLLRLLRERSSRVAIEQLLVKGGAVVLSSPVGEVLKEASAAESAGASEVPIPASVPQPPKGEEVESLVDSLWSTLRTIGAFAYLPAEIELASGTLGWRDAVGELVLLSDIRGRVLHDRADARFEGALHGSAEGELILDYTQESVQGSLRAEDFPLESVVRLLPGLRGTIQQGRATVDLRFQSPLSGLAQIGGRVSVADLAITSEPLGDVRLSDIDAVYEFDCTYDADAPLPPPRLYGVATESNPTVIAAAQRETSLQLPAARGELLFRRGDLLINGVELELVPALRGLFSEDPGNPHPEILPVRTELRVTLPATDLQILVDALPTALVGPFLGMTIDGSLAWNLDLEVPNARIAEMNWKSSTELEGFEVTAIPAALDVYRLKRRFTYALPDGRYGFKRLIEVPPPRDVSMQWKRDVSERTDRQIGRADLADALQGSSPRLLRSLPEELPEESPFGYPGDPVDTSYRYVYLEKMSPWIPKAVLTTEDGDFFFHKGINWFSFKNAVERNIRAGEIELGASTLTMQLVKNLFLNNNRAFLRKLHEAFLVFLLENDSGVSKERILELYLNLVEFGPNIYGVDEAARYYFGTSPGELNVVEALWLATILPSPRRYHRYFEAGAISDGWHNHMKNYLDIMFERGRMTEEEHARAVTMRPQFRDLEIH